MNLKPAEFVQIETGMSPRNELQRNRICRRIMSVCAWKYFGFNNTVTLFNATDTKYQVVTKHNYHLGGNSNDYL